MRVAVERRGQRLGPLTRLQGVVDPAGAEKHAHTRHHGSHDLTRRGGLFSQRDRLRKQGLGRGVVSSARGRIGARDPNLGRERSWRAEPIAGRVRPRQREVLQILGSADMVAIVRDRSPDVGLQASRTMRLRRAQRLQELFIARLVRASAGRNEAARKLGFGE